MPKYSIKLGEIHLRSDSPITAEEKRRAIKELDARDNIVAELPDDLIITSTIYRH